MLLDRFRDAVSGQALNQDLVQLSAQVQVEFNRITSVKIGVFSRDMKPDQGLSPDLPVEVKREAIIVDVPQGGESQANGLSAPLQGRGRLSRLVADLPRLLAFEFPVLNGDIPGLEEDRHLSGEAPGAGQAVQPDRVEERR